MYVLSAWNDCYETLSAVLTLHAVFLPSIMRVVAYGWDNHEPIFNVIYKNRKMMQFSNFKRTSLWKFQSHIKTLEREGAFSPIILTVNSETKCGDRLNFMMYPRKFLSLWRSCIKFLTLSGYWFKPYKK